MTQLVLNIEHPSILPSLRKVLSLMDGVTIARPQRKTRLQKAVEEAKKGPTFQTNDINELMAHLTA